MRQFVTWQWWVSVAALVLGAVLIVGLVGGPGDDTPAEVREPQTRRIDVAAAATSVETSESWRVRDGVTLGTATVRLADGRIVRIAPGTVGVDDCRRRADVSGCVLFADMLGDAVVWFALVDRDGTSTEVRLPAIRTLLDGVTWARLSNGWELPLLAVVERRCTRETLSLGNFVETFGDRSVTVFDVEAGEVSAVECRRR